MYRSAVEPRYNEPLWKEIPNLRDFIYLYSFGKVTNRNMYGWNRTRLAVKEGGDLGGSNPLRILLAVVNNYYVFEEKPAIYRVSSLSHAGDHRNFSKVHENATLASEATAARHSL